MASGFNFFWMTVHQTKETQRTHDAFVKTGKL